MLERGPLLQTGTVLLDGWDQEVASGGAQRRGIWHKLGPNGIKPTVAAALRTGTLSIPPWSQRDDVREEIGSNEPPRQSAAQNFRRALRYWLWSFMTTSFKEGNSFNLCRNMCHSAAANSPLESFHTCWLKWTARLTTFISFQQKTKQFFISTLSSCRIMTFSFSCHFSNRISES